MTADWVRIGNVILIEAEACLAISPWNIDPLDNVRQMLLFA